MSRQQPRLLQQTQSKTSNRQQSILPLALYWKIRESIKARQAKHPFTKFGYQGQIFIYMQETTVFTRNLPSAAVQAALPALS